MTFVAVAALIGCGPKDMSEDDVQLADVGSDDTARSDVERPPDAASDTDDMPPDTTEMPDTSEAPDGGHQDGGDDVPGFQTIWETLDDEHGCGAGFCHGGSAPDIDSRDLLVGVTSNSRNCSGETLVEPGEPDNSLFFRKIDPDTPASEVCGQAMPPNGPALSQQEADMVREWIEAGAPK